MERQRMRTRLVSTEEKTVNISPPKKHKLSKSEHPSFSKKIRQHKRSKQDVKNITKAVMAKLLTQTTDKTPQRKNRRQKKTTPLACTFGSGSEPSSLEFDSPIEADGVSPSTNAVALEADGGDAEDQGSSTDPKVIEEVGDKLRAIGDKINDEVTKVIFKAAVKIVKDKSYNKFRESMDVMVDQIQHYAGDESERYFVSIVWLLTKTIIAKAKEVHASYSTMEVVVEGATDYITDNYPGWIDE